MPREYSSEETVNENKLMKVIDAGTGGKVAVQAFPNRGDSETPMSLRDSTFRKIATKPLTKAAGNLLRAPANADAEIDILPTGEIYMSHVFVRRRLSDAVGVMGWALRPLATVAIDPLSNTMYREYALVILGRVVATAFGSTKYYPQNKRMDFADAAEAVKSNALTRCCKDLNIGSECWDRRFAEEWRNKYAVHVRYIDRDMDGRDKEAKGWRRIDQRPFHREYDIFPDSPNQESWRQQHEAWKAMIASDKAAKKEITNDLRERVLGKQKSSGGESTNARNQRTEEPIPAEPVRSEPFTASRQTGPASHNIHGESADAKPFLILNCKVSSKSGPKDKKKWTHYVIEMMNGDKYYTFSSSTYEEMTKIWAARQRVKIEWTSHKTGTGTEFKDIVEWKVMQ